jgi:cobaltochelatase CobN
MPNPVFRADGRRINVRRTRGQIFVCADGCCCGRTELGYAPVPAALFHGEWERRRLRNYVHLTMGGCLGPCALANVVLLLFGPRALWFHSINDESLVLALYDYVETLLAADGFVSPPAELERYRFTASTWENRPDGTPVQDIGLGPRGADPDLEEHACQISVASDEADDRTPDRLVANMDGMAAVPRKNGELVFEAPWEGRVFGMAVALHEREAYGWDAFRDGLIAAIAEAESRDERSGYYERWLASFETLLAEKGLLSKAELDRRTDEFEWGFRDEVY